MGAPEKKLTNEYLENLPPNERLFRINAGMGWAGKVVRHDGSFLILEKPRPFRGAPEGWPDLFGWTTIEVTPDMVGQKIAVATGLEVKATGKLSKVQKKFGEILSSMGGIFTTLKPKK